MEPMRDAREDEREELDRVDTLANKYVKIRKTQHCAECGRFHDIGSIMHYSSGNVAGELRQVWACFDCEKDIQYERVPWKPEGTRLNSALGLSSGEDPEGKKKPRFVRNFWLEAKVDGRESKVIGGPANKEGGFQLRIKMRDQGEVTIPVTLEGYADGDRLRVNVFGPEGTAVWHHETQR
jgi:hypothetical protein